MPGCCVHSGCIRCTHDAARGTKKRSDEGRCHYRPVVKLTHSAWLVNHSLSVYQFNRDVPQEVVRKILDHDSPAMTAHSPEWLHDSTVREHWNGHAKSTPAAKLSPSTQAARSATPPGPGTNSPAPPRPCPTGTASSQS